MGRWLARLATEEKNADTLETETPKTPKTQLEAILGVLGARQPGKCVKYSDDETARAEFEERAAILEYDQGLSR